MLPAGGSWLRGLRAVFGGSSKPIFVQGGLPRAHWPSPRMRRRTRSDLEPPGVEAALPTTGPGDVHILYRRAGWYALAGFEKWPHADLGDGLLEQLQLFGDDFQAGAAGHPVTYPPGRARLAMSPTPTGSRTPIMTMGIVSVAFLAAVIFGDRTATMMSTLSLISNSAARSGQTCSSYLPQFIDNSLTRVPALNPPELAQPCSATRC